jgi:putative PEP-CTERM system TPR-repeat lipoprotein
MIRNFLIVLLALSLVACDSESTEQYITKATQAMARAKYTAAGIELKNALRQDPKSAQARWLLGEVYLKTGDMVSASKEFRQALDLGWLPDDVLPGLGQALLAQGEFEEVGKLDPQELSLDAQTAVYGLQAQAALALGDSWEAEQLIDKALALQPESLDALFAKALFLRSKDDIKGALAVIEQIIALDPKRGLAWSVKGDILANQGEYQAAIDALTKAIQFQRNNTGELFKRALLKIQLGDFEAAQFDANVLMRKAGKHPGSNYIAGMLQFEAGNYDEAITSLMVTEPAFKQYPLTLFFLASANLKKDNMDLAANQAERFHKFSPDSVQGRKLLAYIRQQQRDFASVPPLLQPVLDSNPEDIDALNLTASALLQEGNTSEAIELLNKVATLQPDSAEAQVRLGAGMLAGGKGDDAMQPIQTALQMDPNIPMADILLVLNHMQNKDYPAAIAAAEDYKNRNADSVAPRNLLGRVYREAGQPEKAREAFEGALALDSSDVGANFYLAQLALDVDDTVTARRYYETILSVERNSMPTLIQLAMLDAREGKEEALIEHLEKAIAAAPNALEPRLLLARYYLAKGKPVKIAPLFTSLNALQQQTPEVLQLMALAQLSTKDASAAQFSLEQLLESTPDSAEIRHLLAMAAAEQGDTERTADELRRALTLNENYLPSRIALARIALGTNASEELETQMAKLVEMAPDNPDVLLLQAAVAQKNGEPRQAKNFAEKAFKLAPSGNSLTALAVYQDAVGERGAALKRFADWLEKHPDDIPVRMAYAGTLIADGQEPKSTIQYDIILQAAPDNLTALNNQAWILRKDNPAQALEHAQAAAQLAPDSPAVLDTLAVVQYHNKEYEQAQRNIQRALKASPDEPSMRYHKAMIAVALNDKPGARAMLEELLAANKSFPEEAEARALLAELQN